MGASSRRSSTTHPGRKHRRSSATAEVPSVTSSCSGSARDDRGWRQRPTETGDRRACRFNPARRILIHCLARSLRWRLCDEEELMSARNIAVVLFTMAPLLLGAQRIVPPHALTSQRRRQAAHTDPVLPWSERSSRQDRSRACPATSASHRASSRRDRRSARGRRSARRR